MSIKKYNNHLDHTHTCAHTRTIHTRARIPAIMWSTTGNVTLVMEFLCHTLYNYPNPQLWPWFLILKLLT